MSIYDKLWSDRDAANQVDMTPVASDKLGPSHPLKGMVSKQKAVEQLQAEAQAAREKNVMYEYMGY